ncbi:[formate-C-acetyltransferase]-activating enzyme [Aeromonas jandaei]
MSCDMRIPCHWVEASDASTRARIFNIQRYSLNDGEGIRTVVFFKGCPLKCPWCANPESQALDKTHIRRMARCLHCDECANDVVECPSGAYEEVGRDMTVELVLAEIEKDEVFFRTSGGGVTLSGGEVLAQADFAIALLARLKALGYRTAIETSGHGNTHKLLRLAELCDEVLFDFKIMDEARAREVIGINQPRVLDHFGQLVKKGIRVIPRLPLIPGFTLDMDNLSRVLDFLAPFTLGEIHLLPFHQYGASKYDTFGIPYQMKYIAVPTAQEIAVIRDYVTARGYRVTIGG